MMARKILIDCDPGTDDAIALFMALGDPRLDVRLVTVAGGNVGLAHTLRNARALVGLTGRAVPVVAGAERPLLGSFEDAAYVHGEDGLGGVKLPEVVLMTGAWGEGNVTPAAEFNAWSDPEALAVVLGCGRPVTLATLEVTAQALATPARIEALSRGGTGACREAACAILAGTPPSRRLGGAGSPQHDSCAIAWLLAPEAFTTREVFAEVDCGVGPGRGQTLIDRWGRLGRPANALVLETLEAGRFFEVLEQSLSRLP
jgi:purine nucleosidase